ncbi:SsrA-binding protein SmpB [Candidatus Peregrinibacteria bacterium]|nr:MAG: SsrA-binding protein SmpB [Candidatus Peregrinibacteria bacterium]
MQKSLVQNRRARFDYEVLERFEAGIVLKGHEVKSIKKGGAHFTGAYITVDKGEAFIKHFHVAPYEHANLEGYDPEKTRKLLLHKKEILKIAGALDTKGVTVVPLECGLVKGKIKIDIAIGRGKKQYDKRDSIKKRDLQRHIETSLRD